MNKLKLLIVLVLTAQLLLAGCVSAPTDQPGNAGASKQPNTAGKIRIGFAMDTLKEERWQRDKAAFEEYCKEKGVELQLTVANNDEKTQANDVDNMLTKGVDVIVIAPHNATQAAAMVEKAKAQGVPVISYDRLIKSDKIDLYVSHQVTRIGEMQAKYALEKAPKGNYIMVYGASTDNNALLLKDAQLAAFKPSVDKGDIKIVADQHATDWRPEEARKIVENALTQNNNNVAAVVASNDGTAGGACEALAAQNLAGKVIVTGQDADLAALQRIVEGRQSMTIYKPIKPLAQGAIDAAIALAKKETPKSNAKIKAVNQEVPALLFDPVTVDKNNLMETVIKDGYQKFDDVYKNVPAGERPKQAMSNVQSQMSKVFLAFVAFFVTDEVVTGARGVSLANEPPGE
jgi:D-xylose transport system substrate-binding protein